MATDTVIARYERKTHEKNSLYYAYHSLIDRLDGIIC